MMNNNISDLVEKSFNKGEFFLSQRSVESRKQLGQFFTPTKVARYMLQQLGPIRTGDKILDPAVGSGVLLCAVIEYVINNGGVEEVWLDGYEIDREVYQIASDVLEAARQKAASCGITIHLSMFQDDFLLNSFPIRQRDFFKPTENCDIEFKKYHRIIANPPYFKINQDDPRLNLLGNIKGRTNIYTLFMGVAQRKLVEGGTACFIVPRSFCSGAYFESFHREFIRKVYPSQVHVFNFRHNIFHWAVLQENVIVTFQRKRNGLHKNSLDISTSRNVDDLDMTPIKRRVTLNQFLGTRDGKFFFRLPVGELDEQIIASFDKWEGSLEKYGLKVSTGPVVPFRAKSFLSDDVEPTGAYVPLLWTNNVRAQDVSWPLTDSSKQQYIQWSKQSQKLLVPVSNYVLVRRFSAKEEIRRLIAAPFFGEKYDFSFIGLENHLNFIYRNEGTLTTEESVGISTMLNCALVDRYFRIINGNTQVNAIDLRRLPLPSLGVIKILGQRVLAVEKTGLNVDIDGLTFSIIRDSGYLPPDFPTIRETRYSMGKIQQAQKLLRALGMPEAQQNEISALTLLVLAQLSEETRWRDANRRSLRIHDMLLEIRMRYQGEYAENTRETIRRQVIHQFEQAGLVAKNPDNPALPTNSPKIHYGLTDPVLQTIQAYL